jgi:hypothetical protein
MRVQGYGQEISCAAAAAALAPMAVLTSLSRARSDDAFALRRDPHAARVAHDTIALCTIIPFCIPICRLSACA